jgi:ABC-2 type transport system ATP-binding protein
VTAAAVDTLAVAKRFGEKTALHDLTMTVGRGEVFGFLGPNGAGKTTAVKIFLGLVRPTSGAGEVLGAPLGDREARRKIGYLPELFRYQGWLTSAEVLELHAQLLDVPRARRAADIAEILHLVGLHARADDRVETYSKGMQQRLGVGVALLGEPDLVFLDEPTSALDPVGRNDVRAIVEGLKARGATVFLNSHLLTEVERVCDRVAVVDRGRVVASGSIDDMLGTSTSARINLGASVDASAIAILRSFGELEIDTPWFTVRGIGDDAVPELVRRLVSAGAEIHAVEPARTTLEERFLQLLKVPDADTDDRTSHPA